MKRVIVVGSGAGGAAVARELQGAAEVIVLEAGGEFKPFEWDLKFPERAKRAGLLFDPREISLLFPSMKIDKAGDGMVLVRGRGTGGTTTLATANAVRADDDFRTLGIDLDEQFAELAGEVPITTAHRRIWRRPTEKLFEIAASMGLDPEPTPKIGHHERCRNCGRCVFGCPHGVKWDSRIFLKEAVAKGARIETRAKVERVVIRQGLAEGVVVKKGLRRRFFPADLVVLAAGGAGTPVILQDSGIAFEPRLFVDPVLCVASPFPNALQNVELPMPFYVRRNGYMLSPYFDHLSYFFNRRWRPPARHILSLMIKLADSNAGIIEGRSVRKILNPRDRMRLGEAVGLCTEIFAHLGIREDGLFLGILNAGHPGGTFPLTATDARTLHSPRLPKNVYVADASLFPSSSGLPPILTIMALAKAVARRIPL